MPRVVLLNLVAAALLVGVIWTIQVVHYPLFDGVDPRDWPAYEARHRDRITIVVLPLMLANVALAAALLRSGPSVALGRVNAALAVFAFVVTGIVFAPLHETLQSGWDAGTHAQLVGLNWLRTAAWSAQVVVAWTLLQRAWTAPRDEFASAPSSSPATSR